PHQRCDHRGDAGDRGRDRRGDAEGQCSRARQGPDREEPGQVGGREDQEGGEEQERRAGHPSCSGRARSRYCAAGSASSIARWRARCVVRFSDALVRASCSARKDRKSTRLNSSHVSISYAVFCLKKKKVFSAKDFLKSTMMYDNHIY